MNPNPNPNVPPGVALNEAGYVLHGYQPGAGVPVPAAPAAGSRWMGSVAVDSSWQQAQRQGMYPGQMVWQQAPAALPGSHYAPGMAPVRMPQYPGYSGQLAGPYAASPQLPDSSQPLPRLDPSSSSGHLPAPSQLYGAPPSSAAPPTSKANLAGKVTCLICSQAIKSIAAGSDSVRVQMITLTPGLQEALAEATSAMNTSCPHFHTPLAFDAESRIITAELEDCSDPAVARWFLECYQQHHPHFANLPTAAQLLGRDDAMLANATAAFRGDKSYIRAVLVQQCRNSWLRLFPFVCALDWEVTPGYPQNGRGDTVLTDGRGCYLVVHLKHVSPESGKSARQQRAMKRKTAREHSRKYASIFASQRPEAVLVLGGYFTNDEGMVVLSEEVPEVKVVLEAMLAMAKERPEAVAAAGGTGQEGASRGEAAGGQQQQQQQQEEGAAGDELEEIIFDLEAVKLDDNNRPSHRPQVFLPVGSTAVQLVAPTGPLAPRRVLRPAATAAALAQQPGAAAAASQPLSGEASATGPGSSHISPVDSETASAAAAAPAEAAAVVSGSGHDSQDTGSGQGSGGSPRDWGDAVLQLQRAMSMVDVHVNWQPALDELLRRDAELQEQLQQWHALCKRLAGTEETGGVSRQVVQALQRLSENDTVLCQLYDQMVALLSERHRLQRKIGQQLSKVADVQPPAS